jgi:hypothetical protein
VRCNERSAQATGKGGKVSKLLLSPTMRVIAFAPGATVAQNVD